IAGEDPARAIAAMRRRRQPDYEQPCPRITKIRHRLSPIFRVAKRRPLVARHLPAIFNQPWAARAGDNLPIERLTRLWTAHRVSFHAVVIAGAAREDKRGGGASIGGLY